MPYISQISARRISDIVIAVTPPNADGVRVLPCSPGNPDREIRYILRRLEELAAARSDVDPWEHDQAERDAIQHEPWSVYTWLRHPAVHLEDE
jgi:hypothetical protein